MKFARYLVLALAILTIAAGMEVSAKAFEGPAYVRSNYWIYTVTGHIRGPAGGAFDSDAILDVSGQRIIRVAAADPSAIALVDRLTLIMTGSVTVQDPTNPANLLHVNLVIDMAMNVTRSLSGTEAGDTNFSGALFANVTATFTDYGFSLSLGAKVTVVSNLVDNTWTFPLDVGSRGSSTSHAVTHFEWTSWPPILGTPPQPTDSSSNATTQYVAALPEEVQAAGSSFNSLPVDSWTNTTGDTSGGFTLPGAGGGNRTRTFYVPEIGAPARIETYDGQGTKVLQMTLTEYRYGHALAATLGAIHAVGDAPFSVTFNATAIGGSPPYTYAWDFGDGEVSSLRNPTHVFQRTGSYTVHLLVTDATGTTVSRTLQVVTNPTLTIDPSADRMEGTPPLAVNFRANPSGGTGAYGYSWDFGDGSPVARDRDVSHTYKAPGTYTVTLRTTDEVNTTVERTLIVTVRPLPWWRSTPFSEAPVLAGTVAVAAAALAATAAVARRRKRSGLPPGGLQPPRANEGVPPQGLIEGSAEGQAPLGVPPPPEERASDDEGPR